MNNIAQHFTAAFLALHLRGDEDMRVYLEPDRWEGFDPQTARGLQLERLGLGDTV